MTPGQLQQGQPQRLFIVADIGGAQDFHMGDEAMLEANLQALRNLFPAIEFVATSRDPVWTQHRYAVQALLAPTFADLTLPAPNWDTEPEVRRQTNWLLSEEIVAALRRADALIVSGGGNLCSTWPSKILERVALIHCARDLGKPAVVLGQTLGPNLTTRESALLAGALQRAQLVSVREHSSRELALALQVPAERVRLQYDDAFFLEPQAVTDNRAGFLKEHARPWIVLTLDASLGGIANQQRLEGLAAQLDALAAATGGALVFVPHVGGADVPEAFADPTVGRRLADMMRTPLHLIDPWQPREVLWLIGQAALVISTRYHGLVFATASAVPALGIYSDDYTRVKLQGAMGHGEHSSWTLDLDSAAKGEMLLTAMELWHCRSAVREQFQGLRAAAALAEPARWEEVTRALALQGEATSQPRPWAEQLAAANGAAAGADILPAEDLLSDEQWRLYEQQGYLRLGLILDASELAALQQRIDSIMLTKVQGLEGDPLFLSLLRRALFREICRHHYGAHASVSLFRAMVMSMPANQGTHVPWHQDGGDVWKLDRDPLVTIWVALDAATRKSGCLQVIPGSHRLGLLSKRGSTLSAEHVQRYCAQGDIAYLEVQAGEALLLHNWLIQRSEVNVTDAPRRAFTACYMDGRTLGTLTGKRFPVIFGQREDAGTALHFLRSVDDENRLLRAMAQEAERYAKSLETEFERVRAERYTQSLEAELDRLRAELGPRRSIDRLVGGLWRRIVHGSTKQAPS